MSSDGSRREFIDSAIRFAKDRNFNGVDLDFEFPGTGDSPPDDKHRFTQLVQEMKTSFEAEGLILSAAVAAGKWTIDSGYEMGDVCGALDFVNLMAYDFHGPWDEEPKAGFNAPLFAGDGFAEELNVDYAARYWADGGCARDKLVIGMATYGRGFTLANEAENGPGAATTGPSSAGPFTGEEGILAYYEICDMKTEIKFDDKQKVPYTNAGNQWVGFDNEQSLTEKVKYVKDGGFAGWMTWTLDMDDFTGNHCGAGPYPLHKALNAAS
jgi:chitinase